MEQLVQQRGSLPFVFRFASVRCGLFFCCPQIGQIPIHKCCRDSYNVLSGLFIYLRPLVDIWNINLSGFIVLLPQLFVLMVKSGQAKKHPDESGQVVFGSNAGY